MSSNSVKPRIVVSSCLGFEATRYDGSMLDNAFVRELRNKNAVEFITVCPEVAIGLGVPRETLRIVKKDGKNHLVQPNTEMDFTEDMIDFTREFTANLVADGFIFKADSPSVGTDHVKVYQTEKSYSAKRGGAGFFTSQIIEKYPNYPLQSDRRLHSIYIQDSFLTKVYTLARFRKEVLEGNHEEIKNFHDSNYYLLLAHSPDLLKELEKLIKKKIEKPEISTYFNLLREIIKDGSSRSNLITCFKEMMVDIKNHISDRLVELANRRLKDFSNNGVPKLAILNLMEALATTSGNEYLINQTLFNPYPLELVKREDELQDRFLISAYDTE